MNNLLDNLFGADPAIDWRNVFYWFVSMLVIVIVARRIKTPGRPDPDPYADAEFDENGAVRKAEREEKQA